MDDFSQQTILKWKKINISSFILFFWLFIFVFKLSSNDFRVIKHVDNFFLDFYSLSCPEYHENPTSELQKKTGINAYVQRAAIIVKKKKKRCGFQSKKGSGFTWKGGSIRVMDRRMDRDCTDRNQGKEEGSRREGKRIFREKWETDERGRIYRYVRTRFPATTTLVQLISPFSIQPLSLYARIPPPEVEDSSHFRPLKIKPSIGRGIYSQPPVQEFTLSRGAKIFHDSLVLSRKRFRSIGDKFDPCQWYNVWNVSDEYSCDVWVYGSEH